MKQTVSETEMCSIINLDRARLQTIKDAAGLSVLEDLTIVLTSRGYTLDEIRDMWNQSISKKKLQKIYNSAVKQIMSVV